MTDLTRLRQLAGLQPVSLVTNDIEEAVDPTGVKQTNFPTKSSAFFNQAMRDASEARREDEAKKKQEMIGKKELAPKTSPRPRPRPAGAS